MNKNVTGHIELVFKNVNCVGANAVVLDSIVFVPDDKERKKRKVGKAK